MTQHPIDRFTLPRDIPDDAVSVTPAQAGVAAGTERRVEEDPSVRWDDAQCGGEDDTARGYAASHPAGRGWIPGSRDLGIPSEHIPAHRRARDVYAFPDRTVRIEHSFPDGTPDDPVAAIGTSEVFTRERRVRFLDHLAFKGNVRASAALVGVSHETAYRKRRQDAAFAQLWDARWSMRALTARACSAAARSTGSRSRSSTRGRSPVTACTTIRASCSPTSGGSIAWSRATAPRPTPRAPPPAASTSCSRNTPGTSRRRTSPMPRARSATPGAAGARARQAGSRSVGGPLARVPLAGKGRPPPPPTRAEYVTYRRNEAIEDFAAASEDEAHPEWSEDAEAEAVAQAGEDAALEWDDHHAQCLATVGRIVGAEDDDAEEDWDEEGWDEVGELQSSSPLVGEEGGAPAPEGEGSAAPAAASTAGETAAAAADPSPDLSRKGRGEAPQPSPAPDPDPDEVPTDLPYEIKSMPPVTHPNPQTRAFPRPATVSHVSTPPQRTAGSRHSTAPCARPVAGGETLPASLVHSPRAASAVPPFTLPSTPAPLSSSEGERP